MTGSRVAIDLGFLGFHERLSQRDARQVSQFVMAFHRDPSQPGFSVHQLDRMGDPKLCSARISGNLRAIMYHDDGVYVLLHADRHDEAYEWARRRRITRDVLQDGLVIIVSREVIEERVVPVDPGVVTDEEPETPPQPLLARHDDAVLLATGVPADLIPALREIVDEDAFDAAVAELPGDVGDRLYALYLGEPIERPEVARRPARPIIVPQDEAELARILEAPLPAWITFLHPSQQRLATRSFGGPAKVTGTAGTGKTVVAMHRANHLARAGRRVLVTTYVATLVDAIAANLDLLCDSADRDRISVLTLHSAAQRLLLQAGERVGPVDDKRLRELMESARVAAGCGAPLSMLMAEWDAVLQPEGITTWDAYRGVSRAGRGRGLSVVERRQLWRVFERVIAELQARSLEDWGGICRRAREAIESGRVTSPYDAVIVDEVQDLGPQELRLVAALAGTGQDRLLVVGDAGQRLYRRRFSLRSLGIDVRGRSHVLRINYRTTEQIRRFADRVLAPAGDNLDDEAELRRRCRSLIQGPQPQYRGCASREEQQEWLAAEIQRCLENGRTPDEIAVFARTNPIVDELKDALRARGIPARKLNQRDREGEAAVTVGTLHRAKGLEYKVVFVASASDDLLPHPTALANKDDPADYQTALDQERSLLYVGLTRARDEVAVSWVGEPSRFLEEALTAPMTPVG